MIAGAIKISYSATGDGTANYLANDLDQGAFVSALPGSAYYAPMVAETIATAAK